MRDARRLVVILPLLALSALIISSLADGWTPEAASSPAARCTLEAKVCADGSTVGRGGPNCEFAACPAAPVAATTTATTTKTAGDVTLKVGKTGTVGNLSITFNALVQDNRCPVDVQCIEAGAVTANVTFASGAQKVTKNMPSDEVPQEFVGHIISILKTTPPAMSGVEIPAKDYAVTFHISNQYFQ